MTPRLVPILSFACAVAAAGWVGVHAARATWHGAGHVALPPVTIAIAAEEATAPLPDLEPILARHLFGALPEEEAPELAEATKTRLDLVLHGIVLSGDPERSIAYISAPGKPTKGFATGEPVRGQAVVREIREVNVVLDVDGRIETLGFARPGTSGPTNQIRAKILAATGQSSVPAAGSTPDQAIDFWRQRIAQNPQAVLDQLGLEATDSGYVIGAETHAGVRRAGFRPGDVVARVNGTAVGNVEADRRRYDEIAASGRARVELIRGGKPIVLTFPLR